MAKKPYDAYKKLVKAADPLEFARLKLEDEIVLFRQELSDPEKWKPLSVEQRRMLMNRLSSILLSVRKSR